MPLLYSAAFCLPHLNPWSQSVLLYPVSLLVQESEPQFLSAPSSLSLFVPELLRLWSISGGRNLEPDIIADPGLYIGVAWHLDLGLPVSMGSVCPSAPTTHHYTGSTSGISTVEIVIYTGFLAGPWAVWPQPW